VARVHGRFGLQLAVKLIHGDADERLERAGLTKMPTFGNLKDHPAPWLVALLRRCVSAGWVSFAGVDRPVVTLTEEGRAVMKGQRPARLLLPPVPRGTGGRARGAGAGGPRSERSRADEQVPGAAEEVRPRGAEPIAPREPAAWRAAGAGRARPPAELDTAALALFEALRRHRLAVARAEGVAPFIVASDRTLRDIAVLRPRDLTELQHAHGVGPHKAARYGPGLLKVVADVIGSRAWTSS
jgi:ATP-dependent DNA helicase RecQ